MRGVFLVMLAAVLLLVATSSNAATARYASASATVAIVDEKEFATVVSRRGAVVPPVSSEIDKPNVVLGGTASVSSAERGATGTSSVTVTDVELLSGRITVRSLTRSADRAGNEITYSGEIEGLRVDGKRFGVIRQERKLELEGGGELFLNEKGVGLRLKTENLEAAIAVVQVGTFERELPDPTPTPKPKKTPRPTPTPTPTPIPTPPPRLTAGGYAFPVVGETFWEDTYGAPRAITISHQGADIFADFGAPVVAVRAGKLIKVGTLEVSGNRLWVIADNGDAFFYAHLSSFANSVRNGKRVEAGDVLGFVGNTGDAEPTPPHLHFEVHPGGLNEDSVNPTTILRSWENREDVPPGAWVQRLGADATERPGALVTIRDFIAE